MQLKGDNDLNVEWMDKEGDGTWVEKIWFLVTGLLPNFSNKIIMYQLSCFHRFQTHVHGLLKLCDECCNQYGN